MYEQYIKQWKKYLVDKWQLDSDFASKAAALVIYSYVYGLNPVITSGYRSIKRQAELVAAWRSGNKQVYMPLPPGKSLHNATDWKGTPAALAMDMVINQPEKAGTIAKYLGIAWAGHKDPVHFGARRGTL